jgi:hypothetical protein
VQHALIILEGLRAYSRSYGRLKPSIKVFVQRDLGPFQIAAQLTLPQFSCQVRLGFPHAPADIREYVARITASPGFSNSERLGELLRYTVMEALEGRGTSLKESGFGRDGVRPQARLRL